MNAIVQMLFFLVFCSTGISAFTIRKKNTNGPVSAQETTPGALPLTRGSTCVTCSCGSGCSVGGAQFCSLQVTNNACIGNTLQVLGDLAVCGKIYNSGIVGIDYAFAYRSTTQTLGVISPTFADIIFTDSPVLNGWVHLPPAAEFLCAQSGDYLIEYDATCRITNSQLSSISIIAVLNGIEIPGSQGTIQLITNNRPLSLTRSFIVHINENDVLKLQFTGKTPFVQLVANSGTSSIATPVNGVRPCITLTITRVT